MSITIKDFSFLAFISNSNSNGSGFIYQFNDQLYVVTAKHLLFKPDQSLISDSIIVTSKQVHESVDTATYYEILDLNKCNLTLDDTLDVVSIHLNFNDNIIIRNNAHRSRVQSDNIFNYNSLNTFQEIYLAGFPTSLKIDIENFDYSNVNFRKGIVTSIYENEFIVDCASYYGMSGGPVFSFDENGNILIIGIINKLVPLFVEWFNNRERSIINTDFENSGYSICTRIDRLIQKIS